MMRSMYSGVSGLKAHQTRMDVIGNNVANVNTNGYKKSRVVFADTLYQNLRYGTAASDSKGGTNPMGVGLGSKVASVDQIMTASTTTTTNKTTDMAVDGNGYFIVKNGSESYYTRAGAFDWDSSYNLVNSNGYMVQGWMSDPEQTTSSGDFLINTSGATTGINLADFQDIAARATENATFAGNLDGSYDIPQVTVAGVTGDINPLGSYGYVTSTAGALTAFGTAGYETGAASAATTLPAAYTFQIALDGDATNHTVTLDPTSVDLTSGANIATAMQNAIQAIGGSTAYTGATVTYNVATGYTITSGTSNASSQVAIAAGSHDSLSPLGLTANAGVAGTNSYTGSAVAATTLPAAYTFNISIDGGTAQTITLDPTSVDLTSGANIATAMQNAIRAIGGAYANVTVSYDSSTGSYTITSGTIGTSSQVAVTAGTSNDCASALLIGSANGATDTAGTYATVPNFNIQIDGDTTAHNISPTTPYTYASGADIAADLQTQIQALGGAYADVTVSYNSSTRGFTITSGSNGGISKVRITTGTAAGGTDISSTIGTTYHDGSAQFPAETDDVKTAQADVYDSLGRKTTVYLRFFKTSAAGGTGTDTTDWACDMSLNPLFDRASGFNALTDFAVAPVDLSKATQAAPAALTLGGAGTTANQIVRVYNLQFDKNGVIAGQTPSAQAWLAQVNLTIDRNTGASYGTGYETGAAGASTTLAGITGPNFNIQVDGDTTAHNISLTNTDATGQAIAADMQTQIQNLGGAYAGVTVTYTTAGQYKITSGTSSSTSQVRVTAGTTDATHTDCAVTLGIGAANGAVDVDGSSLPVQPTQESDADNIVAKLDFTKLTQYSGSSSVRCDSQDGYAAGSMVKYSVGTDGTITAVYDNDQTKSIARVALASFSNPSGLQQVGGTMWQTSVNSGEPVIGEAGTSGKGSIAPNSLEMSNVDLSEEFTDMIVTERGFQANSRIITTSDEMLQELVNLKR